MSVVPYTYMESVIFMGPFQLRMFYDSMIHVGVYIYIYICIYVYINTRIQIHTYIYLRFPGQESQFLLFFSKTSGFSAFL